MAGKDECNPHKKARHGLRCRSHEENGWVRGQQRVFREPRNVGARRSHRWRRAGHCSQRGVLSQPFWEWHISPPHPQHLQGRQTAITYYCLPLGVWRPLKLKQQLSTDACMKHPSALVIINLEYRSWMSCVFKGMGRQICQRSAVRSVSLLQWYLC